MEKNYLNFRDKIIDLFSDDENVKDKNFHILPRNYSRFKSFDLSSTRLDFLLDYHTKKINLLDNKSSGQFNNKLDFRFNYNRFLIDDINRDEENDFAYQLYQDGYYGLDLLNLNINKEYSWETIGHYFARNWLDSQFLLTMIPSLLIENRKIFFNKHNFLVFELGNPKQDIIDMNNINAEAKNGNYFGESHRVNSIQRYVFFTLDGFPIKWNGAKNPIKKENISHLFVTTTEFDGIFDEDLGENDYLRKKLTYRINKQAAFNSTEDTFSDIHEPFILEEEVKRSLNIPVHNSEEPRLEGKVLPTQKVIYKNTKNFIHKKLKKYRNEKIIQPIHAFKRMKMLFLNLQEFELLNFFNREVLLKELFEIKTKSLILNSYDVKWHDRLFSKNYSQLFDYDFIDSLFLLGFYNNKNKNVLVNKFNFDKKHPSFFIEYNAEKMVFKIQTHLLIEKLLA